MSNKPPKEIADRVKEAVYLEADRFSYLSRTRLENGRFLDSLVSHEEIGVKLVQYMKRAEVRTYLKDAVLNRYSKDKTLSARPKDVGAIIISKFGWEVVAIDSAGSVHLYKAVEGGRYVVVSEGTYLKWETALRKALLYIPGKPFAECGSNEIRILLNVFAQYRRVPDSDKEYLAKALAQCGAQVHIFGER